jgi:hypothetical protein
LIYFFSKLCYSTGCSEFDVLEKISMTLLKILDSSEKNHNIPVKRSEKVIKTGYIRAKRIVQIVCVTFLFS